MEDSFPKFTVRDGSSGLQIEAVMGKPYDCAEFVLDRNKEQVIFISPWIQFEPTNFYEDRAKIAIEMIRRYNTHSYLLKEYDRMENMFDQNREHHYKFKEGHYRYWDEVLALNPDIKLPKEKRPDFFTHIDYQI